MTKLWKSGAVLGLALVVAQLAIAATGARNGKLLAFTSLRGGNASLYVANRDGSGARRLTLDGGGAYQGDAAWLLDGTRLVFTCGNFELCVTSANGIGHHSPDEVRRGRITGATTSSLPGHPTARRSSSAGSVAGKVATSGSLAPTGPASRRLVDDPGNEGSPEWSPDGLRIAYTTDAGAGNDLYVIDADGANVQRLTSGKAFETDPIGHRTAPRSPMRAQRPVPSKSEVWLMRASGGGASAPDQPAGSRAGRPTEPSCSCPPRRATMTSSSEFGPMASGRTRLTKRAGGDYTPQLQPAGRTVTLPPAPSIPLAAIHADARTVGTLLARYTYVIRDLSGLATAKRTVDRRCGSCTRPRCGCRPVGTRGVASHLSARKPCQDRRHRRVHRSPGGGSQPARAGAAGAPGQEGRRADRGADQGLQGEPEHDGPAARGRVHEDRAVGGFGEISAVPPGRAARPEAASSVARRATSPRAPCVLARNDHRTPTTSDISPNPPSSDPSPGRSGASRPEGRRHSRSGGCGATRRCSCSRSPRAAGSGSRGG